MAKVNIEDTTDVQPGRSYEQLQADKKFADDIIDTVRESLLVLDTDLIVRRVNNSFLQTFCVTPEETIGQKIYHLGNGQWNIPSLRKLLEDVLPDNKSFQDYEVEHYFPELGYRSMLLNARRIDHLQLILLAIEEFTERKRAERAARDREIGLRLALEAGEMGTWIWDLQTDTATWDAQQLALFGLSSDDETVLTSNDFFERVHPADRNRVQRAVAKHIEEGGEFQEEFRVVRPDGSVRWLVGRGRIITDNGGRPARMTGVNYDTTERKRSEMRQEVLTAELNHRVKNSLATVQGVMTQTLKGARSLEEFGEQFSGRLQALARGHDVLVDSQWRPTEIASLIQQALAPYGKAEQISVDCEDVRLRPEAALAFNLILHELATNAAKYGALAAPNGRVEIDCRLPSKPSLAITFVWREEGGPPVQEPRKKGFGLKLIERIAKHELNGEAEIRFRTEGLECAIRFAHEDLESEELHYGS